MKKFAISDIHGALKTFKALLEDIQLSKNDELYLLGDYIDRGPESKGVIDHIWYLQAEGYQVYCLKGNHEEMLVEGMYSPSVYHEGEKNLIASFGVNHYREIPSNYIDWMAKLDDYFEVDEYILVHAGLDFRTGVDPLNNRRAMLWARHWENEINQEWLDGRIIVHGHTPTKIETIKDRLHILDQIPAIVIDNGCVFGYEGLGRLCAFDLGSREILFRDCLD